MSESDEDSAREVLPMREKQSVREISNKYLNGFIKLIEISEEKGQ